MVRDMDRRIVEGISSLVVGLVVTLLSALFQTPFAQILDVVRMGAPLTWIQHVVPSSLFFIDWINFVTDWIFWLIMDFILTTVAAYFWHRQAKKV